VWYAALSSDATVLNASTQDTMENWDEETLRRVVLSKHGNPRSTTDVCEPDQ